MACITNIFDEILIGESSGGTLEFLFYDSNEDGLPDGGGGTLNIDTLGNVNTEGLPDGDYYIRYFGGEPPCDNELIFFIRVVDQPDAGCGQTIDLCNDNPPINVFSLILCAPDLTGEWSGTMVDSAGWIDNANPTLVMFDPSLVSDGVYEAQYTVDVEPQEGFEIADCENCNDNTTTVTINVQTCNVPPPCDVGQSNYLSVCSSAGCTFDLIDWLLGTPTLGGQWVFLSGAAVIIPSGSQGTVNFQGAPIGVYQFGYNILNLDPDCNLQSIVTVEVKAQPWAGNNGSKALCESSGNTNLFTSLGGNPNTGGTWTLSPSLPNGTFTTNGFINPTTGDAGTYIATYTVSNPVSGACGSVCIDTATVTVIIAENCIANNGSSTVCQDDTVTLSAAILLPTSTTGGTWGVAGVSVNCNNSYTQPCVFSVNGAPAEDHFGDTLQDGDVIDNFLVTGCYLFIYTCMVDPPNQFCGDQGTYTLHVIDCDPACTATVTIQATACALSILSLVGCPNPIYQWQVFQSGNWVAAPPTNSNATYTGLNGQTYRLRVTGCPNCPAIYSNQITVSCPPPPSCSLTCTLTYNTSLQRLEALVTNSGTGAFSVGYQFNKYTTNNANCLLCSGVGVAACSGTVNVPALGSVAVACNQLQTGTEQCWRFVIVGNANCNSTLCCTKIPALSTNSYKLTFPLLTGYKKINIDGADQMQDAQFSCDEYESTDNPPMQLMDGNINCSMAQLVIDINQWLSANGKVGTASLYQAAKACELRIRNTDALFNSMTRNDNTVDPFIPISTFTLCDSVSWHFQGCGSVENFFSGTYQIGVGGYLNPSIGGTFNLFNMLDKYSDEIPHTGTFSTIATCVGIDNSGCISLSQNICTGGGAAPISVNAGSGVVTWTVFTIPLQPNGTHKGYWTFRYTVTLPNGCTECFHLTLWWDDDI